MRQVEQRPRPPHTEACGIPARRLASSALVPGVTSTMTPSPMNLSTRPPAAPPSVCAMGLRVDDASATTERAVKLLDQPFRQAVGPGELDIPAVRGLGGSLLYFVEGKTELGRLWDVDYEPIEMSGHKGAGLTRFDHLSQSRRFRSAGRVQPGSTPRVDRPLVSEASAAVASQGHSDPVCNG